MQLITPLLFTGLATATAITRQVFARDVEIVSVSSIQGSGCPPNTKYEIGLERKAITFGFDAFQIALGDGPDRMNCGITMKVRYPTGCIKTDLQATYHGYTEVKDGASSKHRTWYGFSTGNNDVPDPTVFHGAPWDDGETFVKTEMINGDAKIEGSEPKIVDVYVGFEISLAKTSDNAVGTMLTDQATFALINQEINPGCQ